MQVEKLYKERRKPRPVVLLERIADNFSRLKCDENIPEKECVEGWKNNKKRKRVSESVTKEHFLGCLGLQPKYNTSGWLSRSIADNHQFTIARRTDSTICIVRKPSSRIMHCTQTEESNYALPLSFKSKILPPILPDCQKATYSEYDNLDSDLLIDITSPLGIKMNSFVSAQCYKCAAISDYEQYCNKMQRQEDSRSLRSQTAYCDDRWNLNNIRYVQLPQHVNTDRVIAFGQWNNWERVKTIRTGINKASRKLRREMRPCSVVLEKLAIEPMLVPVPTWAPNCNLITDAHVTREEQHAAPTLTSFRSAISNCSSKTLLSDNDAGYDSGDTCFESTRLTPTKVIRTPKDDPPTMISKSCRITLRCQLRKDVDHDVLAKENKLGTPIQNSSLKPPFVWEDFAENGPKLELEINTSQLPVVDLTEDSDCDGSGMQSPPSSTSIVGKWHQPAQGSTTHQRFGALCKVDMKRLKQPYLRSNARANRTRRHPVLSPRNSTKIPF